MQLVTSVLFLGPFLWGGRASGFPLDDAWIHQVVARTFAETGTLGYLPGAYGAGATSYLWAALLGLGQKLHANPVVWTSSLGIVGALGTGQALLGLVGDDEPDDAAAVVLACAGGDLTWFAVSGMEASLVAAAALGAIAVATTSHRRAPLLAGVLAGVAALTRPDFVPLGLVVSGLVHARRRSPRDTLSSLAPWVVACLLYFGSNALLAGTPMPATMRGRRWLWIDSVQGHASATSLAIDFVFAWAYRLRQFTLGLETNVVFWLATGLASAGVLSAVRRRRVGLLVAAGFTVFHAAVFVVVLPVPGHGGRYQPLVPVLFVLFAVLGSFDLSRALATPRARLAGLGVSGALWLVCLGNAYWEWHLAHRAAVEHVRRTEVAAGLAVRDLPGDAVVASFDVGGIGYFARRSLLDLGALTTPKVMTALDRDDVVDLLRREKVTHVVLPAGEDQDFPDLSNFGFRLRVVDHPEIALTEIASFASDHDTWLRGVWYTQNATFRQRLWKIDFTSCDAGAAALPALSPDVRASVGARGFGGEPGDANRLERAFDAAASRGLCVRVRGPGAPSPLAKADGCWDVDVRFGSETPSPGMPLSVQADLVSSPITEEAELLAAKETLARMTAEHRVAGDVKGVTFAAVHAVVAAVRAKTRCFWTPLPAMEKALPPGWRPPPTPKDTLGLGVVVVGLVLAASFVVARRRAA